MGSSIVLLFIEGNVDPSTAVNSYPSFFFRVAIPRRLTNPFAMKFPLAPESIMAIVRRLLTIHGVRNTSAVADEAIWLSSPWLPLPLELRRFPNHHYLLNSRNSLVGLPNKGVLL